ncbi:YggT family protein [Caulobacter sp. SLTY]|uniref:YggT family protein n=1 Tax=Caulobacter sp. SLTY TaxID=2683262 RepID=UPI00196AC596|nr:YggT family protein [Caulobacter sp. SLTY]
MGLTIFQIVDIILQMAMWLLILRAIVSWLVAFDVINLRNRFAYQVHHFLEAITDPIIRPLQRVLPRWGQLDISALVAILIIIFVRLLWRNVAAPVLINFLG